MSVCELGEGRRGTVALIVLAAFAPAVFGQNNEDRDTRYGEFAILVGPSFSIRTNSLTDLWDPGKALYLSLVTPFTIGRLGVAYRLTRFSGDGVSVPDFDAHGLTGMWGVEVPARSWLRLYGGVSAGAWFMMFHGARANEGSPVETEFTTGAQGRVSICMPRSPLCVFGSLGLARVFTEPSIIQREGSVGASISLATPRWIRNVLDGRPQSQSSSNEDSSSTQSPQPSIARPCSNNIDAENAIVAATEHIGRQVITADEMRRAGLTRVGELFTLADLWTTSTNDYFSWWATPLGQAGPMDASYSIMVGDQWLELGPGAVSALDRIGLEIQQLDSVVVSASPQLVAGRFTSSGMVRLFPKPEHSGPGVYLRGLVGNPTGDPGPHLYSEEALRNVDRAGEESAVRFFAGRRRWGLSAGYVHGFHNLLDSRIVTRTRSASSATPVINFSAPTFFVRIGDSGRHSIRITASRLDDYRFMPLQAREVPIRSDWMHAGASGTVWTSSGRTLTYRTAADLNRLQALPNRLDIDGTSRSSVWRSDIELGAQSGNADAPLIGIGFDLETTENGSVDEATSTLRMRAYGQKGWCFAPRTCVSIQAVGSIAAVGPGVHLRGSISRRFSSRLRAFGSLSIERAPEAFVSDLFGVDTSMTTGSRVSADLAVAARVSDRWSIKGTMLFRHQHPGRNLVDPHGVVTADLIPQLTAVVIDSNAVGSFSAVGVAAKWNSRVAGARTSYTLQEHIGASPGMVRRSALVPTHRLRQTFWVRIGDELTTNLSIEARSSLVVPNLFTEQNTMQPVSTEGTVMVDLAVMKWFWRRKARASVRVRDLTNSGTPEHPLGAAPGMTLYLQGEILVSYRRADRLP